MKKMVFSKKGRHFAIGVSVALAVTAIFLFAFYTEPSSNNSVTGAVTGMEGVSGMIAFPEIKNTNTLNNNNNYVWYQFEKGRWIEKTGTQNQYETAAHINPTIYQTQDGKIKYYNKNTYNPNKAGTDSDAAIILTKQGNNYVSPDKVLKPDSQVLIPGNTYQVNLGGTWVNLDGVYVNPTEATSAASSQYGNTKIRMTSSSATSPLQKTYYLKTDDGRFFPFQADSQDAANTKALNIFSALPPTDTSTTYIYYSYQVIPSFEDYYALNSGKFTSQNEARTLYNTWIAQQKSPQKTTSTPTTSVNPSDIQVREIPAPDGTSKLYKVGDKLFSTQSEADSYSNNLKFLQDNKGAKVVEGMTSDGNQVYQKPNGDYITASSVSSLTSAIKKEDFGSQKIDVTYTLSQGTATPSKIGSIDVSPELYAKIKSTVTTTDTPTIDTNTKTITITRTNVKDKTASTTITFNANAGTTTTVSITSTGKATSTEFKDGTTLFSKKQGNTGTYSLLSASGKTTNLDNKAYDSLSEDKDISRLATELANAGLGGTVTYNNNNKVYSGASGNTVTKTNTGTIFTKDSNQNYLRMSTSTGTTTFTGKVGDTDIDSNTIKLKTPSSSYTTVNDKGIVASGSVSSDGTKKTEYSYDQTKNTMTITPYTITKDNFVSETQFTISTNPNKQGVYEFSYMNKNYVYEPGFGSGTIKVIEASDGKQTTRDLTDDEKKSLDSQGLLPETIRDGINNQRQNDPERIKARTAVTLAQETVRGYFKAFDQAASTAQGFGYFGTLFMGDEALLEWQTQVDKLFSTTFLGTEYWTSKICKANLDAADGGVGYVDTGTGLASVGAHVQATKTELINRNGTKEYLYKITFAVKNGEYETDKRALKEMRFSIELYGERTATLVKQKLERGKSYSKPKSDPVVQYSNYNYDRICIKFDEIPYSWLISGNEVCNNILAVKEGANIVARAKTNAPDITSGNIQQI